MRKPSSCSCSEGNGPVPAPLTRGVLGRIVDLVWEKGLCRSNYVKNLGMKSSFGLPRWALNSVTYVITQENQAEGGRMLPRAELCPQWLVKS